MFNKTNSHVGIVEHCVIAVQKFLSQDKLSDGVITINLVHLFNHDIEHTWICSIFLQEVFALNFESKSIVRFLSNLESKFETWDARAVRLWASYISKIFFILMNLVA